MGPFPQDWRRITIFALLAFVASVLAYYVRLTAHQPVWWDEAEYLLEAKHIALGTPQTGFAIHQRPFLLPLILSGFYAFGLGEISIRILLAAVSLLSVYLLFLIGERLYSTNVGLLAAILYSLVPLNLFYSNRILTEIPHVALVLLGIYLFLTGRQRLVSLAVPVFVLAALVRTQSIFVFVSTAAFALLTERGQALKNKDYRRSLMLGAVICLIYLSWQQWKFGNPLHSILREIQSNASELELLDRIDGLWDFLRGYLLLPVSVLLLWAAGVMVPASWRGHLRAALFLFLWWSIPTFGYGLLAEHFEDRYAILAYPPIFLWAAVGIVAVSTSVARFHRALALLVALLLGGYAGVRLWQRSDFIIRAKLESFDAVRQAGLWVRQHSGPGDSVICQSVPQITYYSERATYSFPESRSDFLGLLENMRPRFLIISSYEMPPSWAGPAGFAYAADYGEVQEFRDSTGEMRVMWK